LPGRIVRNGEEWGGKKVFLTKIKIIFARALGGEFITSFPAILPGGRTFLFRRGGESLQLKYFRREIRWL